MRPDDVPARRGFRWRRLTAPAMYGLPAVYIGWWAVLVIASGRPIYSAFGATVLTAALALNVYLFTGSTWVARLGRRERRRLALAGWAGQPALVAIVLLIAAGLILPMALAVGAVIGSLVALLYAARRPDTATPPPAPAPPPPRHLPAVPAAERLHAVRSRIARAVQGRDPGRLRDCVPALRQAIADPAQDPAAVLAVADELVQAESELAELSGDDRRYADAIALLNDVVTEHRSIALGRVLLHAHRAQYFTFQAGRAAERLARAVRNGDASARASAERTRHDLYAATEHELRAAVSLATQGGAIWVQQQAMLGLLLCGGVEQGEADRTDEGVELIRRTLTSTSAAADPRTRLNLAAALMMRARQRAGTDPAAQDLAEARVILTGISAGGPPHDQRARGMLTELATIFRPVDARSD